MPILREKTSINFHPHLNYYIFLYHILKITSNLFSSSLKIISPFRSSKRNKKYLEFIPDTMEFNVREMRIKMKEMEDREKEECPVSKGLY